MTVNLANFFPCSLTFSPLDPALVEVPLLDLLPLRRGITLLVVPVQAVLSLACIVKVLLDTHARERADAKGGLELRERLLLTAVIADFVPRFRIS